MALQASGELSSEDILTELNLAAGTSISSGDARIRHLANKPIGSVTSSDFYGRLPYRLVDTRDEAAGGATHTFTGVNFGAYFSGRVLMAVTAVYHANGSLVLNQTSCLIGGVSALGDDAGFGSASRGSIGCGQWLVDDSVNSISGDVSFTTSNAGQRVALMMVALDALEINATASTANQTTGNNPQTATANLLTTAGQWVINALAKTNTNPATFNNVTKREEMIFNAAHTIGVGIDNKVAGGTIPLSCSWSGSSAAGAEGRAYNEA